MTQRIGITILAALGLFTAACSSNKPAAPAEPPKTAESVPPAPTAPPPPDNVIVGEVRSVDPKGHSMVVRTSDGKDHQVHVTPDTEVKSLHDAAVAFGKGAETMAKTTADEVKNGTVAAVHFTEKEGKLIATNVKKASKATVKQTEVVVSKVDKEGQKVYVKTKDGAEHVYDVAKDATIATGNKVSDIGKASGEKLVEGTKATIHFTEKEGQKLLHFLKH